jgi:hypothetical protein
MSAIPSITAVVQGLPLDQRKQLQILAHLKKEITAGRMTMTGAAYNGGEVNIHARAGEPPNRTVRKRCAWQKAGLNHPAEVHRRSKESV